MAQKSDLITAIQLTYDEILAFAGELSVEERSTRRDHDAYALIPF